MSDLLVIPLPWGRNGGIGFCSVLFAPRLHFDGVLGQDVVWRDWPAALSQLQVDVRVDGAPVGFQRSPALVPGAWGAVFPQHTRVDAHAFVDRSGTEVVSLPAHELLGRIEELYSELAATHPSAPPSYAELLATAAGSQLLGTGGPLDAAEGFLSHVGDGSDAAVEEPDFHGWMALLRSHRQLLRHLGLVADLRINLGAGSSPSELRIETNYQTFPGARRAIHPTMRTTPGFHAASDPHPLRREVVDGWLRAGDPGFSLFQTGEAEAIAALLQMRRAGLAPTDEADLPARRSGGLGLFRGGASEAVAARFERQAEIEDLVVEVLQGARSTFDIYAEDVTAGYRFDVWDESDRTWRSLYRRRAKGPYELPRDSSVSITPDPDEGIEVLALAAEGSESSNVVVRPGEVPVRREIRSGPRRADPSLVVWRGWSAAADRPGKVLDSLSGRPVPVPDPAARPGADVQLALAHEVLPGSLPRLRFGRTYRLRGRAVDVAGNSLPPDTRTTPPPEALSNVEPFGRMELVASPPVIRREAPPVPGVHQSPTTIVLLSDYDTPDDRIAPQERVVVPPPVSQMLCELHGLPEGGVDPASYDELSARDAASPDDLGARDPDTGELLWGTGTGEAYTPNPPAVPVPYLPDPAAAGIALTGAPGAGGVVLASWRGSWPTFESGRIVVGAGERPPLVAPTRDELVRLFLPKAAEVTTELACQVDPRRLHAFDGWHRLSSEARRTLRPLIVSGGHWLFSSRVQVRFVHAVRRPLLRPVPQGGTVERPGPGASDAELAVPTAVHGASTGRVILHSRWTETVDDPEDAEGPRPRERLASAGVDLPGREDHAEVAVRHALGTTKRAALRVSAEAVSRFVDYFTEEAHFAWNDPTVVLDGAGVVASTVQVRVGGSRATAGTDYRVDGSAGTITRLPEGSVPEGAEATVRYVSRPVSRLSTEQTDGELLLVAPASVAPPAPVVRDVVPAVTSAEQLSDRHVVREHDGRMVRVWLERPWMSSGDEEHLAVVVGGRDGPVRSRIGRDPGALSASPGILTAESFPRAVVAAEGVDGHDDTLLAHSVEYSPERGRWFADIQLAGDLGYRPWVQLALARYQADAIDGAHRSPIVGAELLRLGLDRSTRVAQLRDGFAVQVSGAEHDGIPDQSGVLHRNRLIAVIQRRETEGEDPELGWIDVSDPVELRRVRSGRWERRFRDPPADGPLRVLLTEQEPAVRGSGATAQMVHETCFVETLPIADAWLP